MNKKTIFAILFLFSLFSVSICNASIQVEQIIGGDTCVLNTGETVKLAGVDSSPLQNPKYGPELQKEALHYISNLLKRGDIEIVDSTPPETTGFAKFVEDSKKKMRKVWNQIYYEFVGSMPDGSSKHKKRSVYLFILRPTKKIDPETFLSVTKDKKVFINQEIIQRGYAKPAKNYNGKYKKTFLTAEQFAKGKHIGIWRL